MKTVMLWNVPRTCHCAILMPVQKFCLVLHGLAQIPHRHLSEHTYLTKHIPQYIIISVWLFLPLFSPLTRLNRGVTQGLPDPMFTRPFYKVHIPIMQVHMTTLQIQMKSITLMELAKYRATGHDHSANLHEKHHLMELTEHRATGHLCPVSYLGPKFW
jgi:hypothetical protein